MRRILISSVIAFSALALAGCSSSGSSTSSVAVAPGPAERAPAVGTGDTASVASGADAGSSDTAADRQVVTTGTATITAASPVTAADRAVSIVEAAGGRVDAQQQKAPVGGDKGSASVTLRIPSTQLTSVLDRLKKLGRVENVRLASDDVTRQTQDLDARITALRASVDRLVALLSKATTAKDFISLENAVSDRQGNLESMEAEQRSLVDQVSLATITVSFVSVADAPVHKPDTFWSGLATGWQSFVGFGAGTLVVIGVLIPWIVFLAVVAAVVLVIVRVRRRSRTVSAGFTPES